VRSFLVLLFLLFINVSQPKAEATYYNRSKQNGLVSQSAAKIWSDPVLLFQLDGGGTIHEPFVISDTYGNIHVFWSVISDTDGEYDEIYYARLDKTGWTTPIDVVAAIPARSPHATISQDGFIYLIWNGIGGISYSRAPIDGAQFAKNWSKPVVLAETNIHASIVTAPSGAIYFAYPGIGNSGVFIQELEPNNLGWFSPRTISLNSLTDTTADYVEIGVSKNGTLHAVWTEFYLPDGWPPRGVFYSRSTDAGDTWSAPVMLGGDGYDLINIAIIDDNNIHVAWDGKAGVGGRYHRWSSDGGQTWSETLETIPAGLGGTEGPPQLVGDQSGTVHMLTTHQGGCAWYTYFENQQWIAPICISGERTLIEEPAMTVSEGNKLHAVFWDNRKSLWYTTKETNASWIPPKTMESRLNQATQIVPPTKSPIITPTVISRISSVNQQLDTQQGFSFSTGQLLIISLVPVMLIIVIIIVLSQKKAS
jgi:hypothetical protein